MDLKFSILGIEFSWDVLFSVSGDMGWSWAWNGCPVLEPFLVFVYRGVRLMTRLGNTLEISSNPMGPVMIVILSPSTRLSIVCNL